MNHIKEKSVWKHKINDNLITIIPSFDEGINFVYHKNGFKDFCIDIDEFYKNWTPYNPFTGQTFNGNISHVTYQWFLDKHLKKENEIFGMIPPPPKLIRS